MPGIVIIGAGQAGAVAARALRRRGYDGPIDIVGSENHAPYQRPPLSKEYLADGDQDGLFLLDEQWCTAKQVRLRLGTRVVRIRAHDAAVELDDGSVLPASSILIATGGTARQLPDVAGEGIHYLRTLEDADRLRTALVPGIRLVVVGAGFIGSEVTATARALGAEVTVIEALEVPLQRILGREIGLACALIHERHGVTLRLGESVESVLATDTGIVVRTSGGRVEGDLLLIGVGIVPNTEMAKRSGIAVENGVLVDEFCRTSIPNVYAAGDVANQYHPVFDERVRVEHFDNANRQAAAAAGSMLGHEAVFRDPHWFWSDQYEHNLQYAGHAPRWDEMVVRGSVEELNFCAFYLLDGVIRGAFGIDRGGDVSIAKELIADRVRVDPGVLADEASELDELLEVEQQR